MPKNSSIKTVLIIGSGPIVIGQACEFDYSGTQACQALREEGCKVILINSNPATIMTDPDIADQIYIEPIEWKIVAKIIEKERPDSVLPTMGGQTALNCVLDLDKHGILEKYQVKTIGADVTAINTAEDRRLFDTAMKEIGLETPRSCIVSSMEETEKALEEIGLPCIIRPSFTLGGGGGGIAYNNDEFRAICESGLRSSPINELLIDESLLGWKEYEMEVVRDKKDNCIIICSIENIDPMGVHTGDSITVAPAQTLSDKEYQKMRQASIAVLRKIGVETGGSNVQFALDPKTGRMIVIEMNPRVSRSSALASKATGFPIAKVATKLALGYSLDELTNDITNNQTPCSFEPTIDYVVTKIPKFAFEKFPKESGELSSQMKSVGEVMGIGGSFASSLQKALRSLEEKDCDGLISLVIGNTANATADANSDTHADKIKRLLGTFHYQKIFHVADAFRLGMSVDDVHERTKIDQWFLQEIKLIIDTELELSQKLIADIDADYMRNLKQLGFADSRMATLLNISEDEFRNYRYNLGIKPVFKRIDSCAAEFSTQTSYFYSSYDKHCEALPTDNQKVIVVGSGPNRIGQGVEFDYCCVHAVLAAKEMGMETVMINCNPETVSTDFQIADRLYFEPITLEDVLHIIDLEQPKGIVLQFGGQTPLKLANALATQKIPILGTQPEAIDAAEDREKFSEIVNKLQLQQPKNGMASNFEQACKVANYIKYPLMVRPSYVLGGRAMSIIYSESELASYMQNAVGVSANNPLLLDSFLEDAIEVDVDAVSDGTNVVIAALMEHIEEAGVHSGDSACSLPPYSLSADVQTKIKQQVNKLAHALQVVGLMNVQFAVQKDNVYIIEVNPRAARTVPFISKCINKPIAKIAMQAMLGKSLIEQNWTKQIVPKFYAVKESVFPFNRFAKSDPVLGPEMKSTGEVMGAGLTFGQAFGKATLATDSLLPNPNDPTQGKYAFISVKDSDKPKIVKVIKKLIHYGFKVLCSTGTATYMNKMDIEVTVVAKVGEARPDIIDRIKNKDVCFVVNTTDSKITSKDSTIIRTNAIHSKVFYVTTIAASFAVCAAIKVALDHKELEVYSLADLHKKL